MVKILKTNRLGVILGFLFVFGIATAGAADQIAVWEVVTTYRRHLDGDGRLILMSDGKTSKGLPWTLIRDKVDFGREGSASPCAGGTYFKGNWVGGWVLHGRVLMNGVTLKSKIVTPVLPPKTAGESMVGTKPAIALKDSIVDLWEFIAVLPGTNKFIRLTCDFTPNKLVVDGDRQIGTYEFHGRSVIVNFLDPQFGRVAFVEKPDNVLSGKGKPVNRKYWKLQFIRVQRQAVYKTTDNKDFILYTNNRVNSPRYTPDLWTTFDWCFETKGGNRRLMCRGSEAKMTAGGRGLTWGKEKLVLIAGVPPR
ncbi:hypothetical protein [Gimesia fumaroli]|uniref:Uncharacterized protein n=1 Tax=Gimesia fumaroli TaxID=2527976 RepID=A0A518IDK6_9PLAN|nr:hypothetical protein [Gimesia fumaroli]QDV51145.1 hypothetical protein Enr17x_31970 [Gimesia fumaroli]